MNREAQFRSLYQRRHTEVLAFFLRRVDRADAIDGAAEVFVEAWRCLDELPVAGERRWLFGTARTVLRRRHRGDHPVVGAASLTSGLPEEMPVPDAIVVRPARDRAVMEALGRLRPTDRDVLLLRLWDEADFEEIGGVLRCSARSAEHRYRRALRRLRRLGPARRHASPASRERAAVPGEGLRDR
jgi:RNA polymerase sigma-70 factor (ECF subfamily)